MTGFDITTVPVKKIIGYILISILVVVVIVIIYKKIKNQIEEAKRNKQSQQTVEESDAAIVSNALSYPASTYGQMADKLFIAMDGAGTDNEAVKEVIAKLKTLSDWNQLVARFGTRETTAWYSTFKGNLVEWLADELSDDDDTREDVNDMLDKFNVQV